MKKKLDRCCKGRIVTVTCLLKTFSKGSRIRSRLIVKREKERNKKSKRTSKAVGPIKIKKVTS